MDLKLIGVINFLSDLKKRDYDMDFASYNATNIIMQEGEIDYFVEEDDDISPIIFDFLVGLDVEPINREKFIRIINELHYLLQGNFEKIEIQLVIYREEIETIYLKYKNKIITQDSLKLALKKYCQKASDLQMLLDILANKRTFS